MPVLKINIYEKKNVYFFTIFKSRIFKIVTFSGHLLPTACEFSMVVPLTKIKIKTLKLSVIKNLH